jgi:hypothetical protein
MTTAIKETAMFKALRLRGQAGGLAHKSRVHSDWQLELSVALLDA